MQRAAWDAVTSTLDQPTDPDAALVAVDQYGYVKAMVGGRDFESDEVNLALGAAAGGSGRGAGLVVQAVRARRGDPPGHLAQLEVRRAGVDHVRRRAGRQARRAVEGQQLRRHRAGRARPRRRHPRVVQHRVRAADARGRARATSPPSPTGSACRPSCPSVPSLVLGSGDVSPLDMAVGYSTFANRGVHNDPILIAKIEQVDEDGDLEVIDQAVPTGERVLSEEEADLVTYCLQEVVKGGTGASAALRQAGGRQDRHHPGQQGRLVRGLHARSSPPRCGSATPTRCPTARCRPWTRTRR